MAHHEFSYVLVGGGLASATAAQHIRQRDPGGAILLLGAEPHLPYHRPPLSKEYLRGEPADLPVLDGNWYAQNAVTVLTNTRAVGLETDAKRLTLDNGDTVTYGKLLLALGASPKIPDLPGMDLPHVRLLRTRDDSDALRPSLSRRLILVGGGYIGVEVASDCLQKGGRPVIVELTSHLWSKFASPEYGQFLQDKLTAAGAEVLLGDAVTAITADGVTTKAGREIKGDAVLVAVGVAPNLDLALAGGLDVDEKKNGILVNEFLETSAPDVWAAGDCAGFFDPVLGKQWRVEHWNNALWHGEIAGENMAGGRVAYDHVPNFFSDELDIHFELFGDPQGGKGGLFHGEPSSNRFDELYVNEAGQVVMTISVNPPKDLLPTLEKLARQRPNVKGREDEIRRADFDLAALLEGEHA